LRQIDDSFLPRKMASPFGASFPGWYAMDSVKWLRRIIVLTRPVARFQGRAVLFTVSRLGCKLYTLFIDRSLQSRDALICHGPGGAR